ncbi:MAG TPA: ABC transporter substrate-binding protein [Candidatus Limnocylindrales bacterium]|nr:ABC transporter substrate-binding protein [Candidatus Limnocylindrales bacterium]
MHRRASTLAMVAILVVGACGTGEATSPPAATGPVASSGGASQPAGTPVVTAQPLSRDPDTLVVAVDAFNADFDPASAYLLSEALIWRGIYESLVRLKGDSASEVEPLLADSWNHNADASSWTFHLHPGVTFTDGTPLDAAAVKANYVRTIGLALGTNLILGSFITDPSNDIVVVDPQTITFNLNAPTPHFDVIMAAQYGTGLVSPKAFTTNSTGPKDQGHDWLQSNAVGTGPYMLDKLSPGDEVDLVQNPSYWRGWSGSHFKKIIIRSIPEAATRRQLLESGDVDIAYAGTAEDTAAVQAEGFTVGDFKNLDMTYIILGEYGPLASPEARQAMNYLFPYDDFLNTVMKGTLQRANGVFPDLLATHDPNVFQYTTDIEKAKALLNTAGVVPGTTLTYEYYTGFGQEAGTVLQAQLEQVGLHLTLKEVEFSQMNADLTTDRPVDKRANMYYWGWWPDYNAPSDYSWILFNSQAAPNVCPCYNSGYYHNATVDKIINDGFTQTNDATLAAEYRQAQDILVRTDPAWIPVGQQLDETYFRTDIQGQVFNPLYILTWDYYALSRG